MDLSKLPEEILPTIFKYLPIDDCKNVRLTSHLWYDACNRLEIVENEKFLIRFDPGEDDVVEIANLIMNCKKLRPKFEFHGFPVWQLPSSVWERGKDAIKSLHFHDCDMRGPTISNIFLNCLNLRSFHLESYCRREKDGFLATSYFGSENALDNLIRCKFEQRNLCLLRLYIPVCLANATYWKLFQIFPNIQTFGRGHSYFDGIPRQSLIEFPPMIQSFTNKEEYSCSWMEPFCESRPTNLKIKELKIILPSIANLYKPNVVHNFFSNNTELEKIKLSGTFFSSKDNLKLLLFHLLNNLPNLKEFKFCTMSYDIPLSVPELNVFLRQISRLETLVLSSSYQFFHPEKQFFISKQLNFQDESSPNIKYTNLTKLKLSFYNQRIYSAILGRCTSLQYLYLKDLPVDSTNVLTRKLWDWDFTKLRTLRLHFLRKRNVSVLATCLPGLKDFVKRLQNLEHLEICGLNLKRYYKKGRNELDYLAELNLPLSLKYFHFEMNRNASPEDLCKFVDLVSGKAPNLETVNLDYSCASSRAVHISKPLQYWSQDKVDLFVNYCQRMKKLKCLILYPLYSPGRYGAGVSPHVEQLFAACQSLKFVCGLSPHNADSIIVSYDRHTAKLKWYINHSIMETLDWFPKFGRPRRMIFAYPYNSALRTNIS